MGQIHNEIRRGVLSEAVTRALGVTRAGGVERFSEEIAPVMDPWEMPEWFYLRSEELFGRWQQTAAVAGEGSMHAIGSPAGSGLIAVVDSMTFNASASMLAYIGFATRAAIAATLTLNNPPNARDTRWAAQIAASPNHITPLEIWSGADATLPFNNPIELGVAPANSVGTPTIGPFVLSPGGYLFVQGTTVNTLFGVSFSGRVRRAYPGEIPAQ
jgi:hypothetical protein